MVSPNKLAFVNVLCESEENMKKETEYGLRIPNEPQFVVFLTVKE